MQASWRLRLKGGNGKDDFGAANIIEPVEDTNRKRVLTGRQRRDPEIVVLGWGIADAGIWCDEDPLAAVHAVLCAIDRGGGIARGKRSGMPSTHFSRSRTNPRIFNQW